MARSMNINHLGDVTMNMTVDADDLKQMAKVLKELGYDQKQRVLYRSLNKTANQSRTEITKRIHKRGGLKAGAVNRHMYSRPASAQNLVFNLSGFGTGMKVTVIKDRTRGNFKSGSWSRSNSGAKWSGPERGKRGSFMIMPEGGKDEKGKQRFRKWGEAGKLDEGVVVTRRGKGRTPLKVEYDDGVGKLMLQVHPVRIAEENMKTVFKPEVFRLAELNLTNGKKKYGL